MPTSHLPPACPVWWSPYSLGLCKAGWVLLLPDHPPCALYPVGGCPLLGLCRSGSTPPHYLPLCALCRHLIDKKPSPILCVCVLVHGTPLPPFSQPPPAINTIQDNPTNNKDNNAKDKKTKDNNKKDNNTTANSYIF